MLDARILSILDRVHMVTAQAGGRLTLRQAAARDNVLLAGWKAHSRAVDALGCRHPEVVALREKLQVVQDQEVRYLHSSKPGRPRKEQ